MDWSNLTAREAYLIGMLDSSLNQKHLKDCECAAHKFVAWFSAHVHEMVMQSEVARKETAHD